MNSLDHLLEIIKNDENILKLMIYEIRLSDCPSHIGLSNCKSDEYENCTERCVDCWESAISQYCANSR